MAKTLPAETATYELEPGDVLHLGGAMIECTDNKEIRVTYPRGMGSRIDRSNRRPVQSRRHTRVDLPRQ